MHRWLAKLRGLLGLGVVGGAAGGIFGGFWWAAATVLGVGGSAFGSLGWTVALWSGFAAFATAGAGILLATLGAKSTLEELSPGRVGAFGALMGLLAPPALILLTGGSWVPFVGVVAGISGLLGGLFGSGLVFAAKRAQAAELEATQGLDAIGPGG